ncbi:hypothetical protein A3F62_04515 [Candidatus Woesebacteria bacterium RIFCSPHIGHO2_12_FULL_44_11]|uniref:Uncharacterized protein n=1 Tax=Candidatus Woesebacteria bacterium RIFCSPLOWO2_01_FULL_44_14 TaxID=1802525 RepID=A0A1F8C2M4_9BACT|nr:MAG: hypothetical protein A3F62_04515 [Candidatus Woesebacteria bacterium RIFCSPHIGHO2_12_FULL_44_11]OGM70502.1 MAG: hypothetical protein A2975_01850 [Candidatus Woesebacteria bacterium RIFCSPLOWO2_01_FULL_44_14]
MTTKQLTKKDILGTIKQAGLVTEKTAKDIVTGIVMDASEAILNGVQRMFDEQNKINDAKFATKEDLQREIGWVRDDIKGLHAELSAKPSREELNRLEARVNRYHPLN